MKIIQYRVIHVIFSEVGIVVVLSVLVLSPAKVSDLVIF